MIRHAWGARICAWEMSHSAHITSWRTVPTSPIHARTPKPKKKRPRARGRGRSKAMRGVLVAGVAELGRHVGERVLQLAAEGIHGRDDRDGDAGSDQAVFDRGGAALVTQKTLEHRHVALPRLSAESRRHSLRYGGELERMSKERPPDFRRIDRQVRAILNNSRYREQVVAEQRAARA